jgi:hypothetical protein
MPSKWRRALALAVAFLGSGLGAHAQVSGLRVVPAGQCGTPTPYAVMLSTVGAPGWLYVDANGLLCTNASGGGGGGGAVTQSTGSSSTPWYFKQVGGDSWAVTVAGGATAANQTTANGILNTIATNTGAAIPAGAANIGFVGAYGHTYNTVAASQTAQVLGATGATGDYLSHCVIAPATLNPGNVIILDNAIAVYTFAGGSASVSTLISWPVPIGATSVSGAWKVTTGASVSVVCTGKFT